MRLAYDGTPLPVRHDEVVQAEVTTRDIDRGDAPHFLLKEIREAPLSFAKTLRGHIVEQDGHLRVALGDQVLPPSVRSRLESGTIRRVLCIGQGTAAVASQSVAALLARLSHDQLDIDPITATELSGFHLRPRMADTLVIAVSQSGTTTDTNRTVDLARARGAAVIGIVNRRQSDLTDKADGVLYTSDGRDVEMSVASTKAFYSQVAAGALLACAITEAAGCGSGRRAAHAPRRAPRAARARCTASSRCSPRSPRWPAGWPRPAATGRWSGTGPTRWPPRRSGSSSASSATSRSPATSPRTRSTSTSRRSR